MADAPGEEVTAPDQEVPAGDSLDAHLAEEEREVVQDPPSPAAVSGLVERFGIEPFSDFSVK